MLLGPEGYFRKSSSMPPLLAKSRQICLKLLQLSKTLHHTFPDTAEHIGQRMQRTQGKLPLLTSTDRKLLQQLGVL